MLRKFVDNVKLELSGGVLKITNRDGHVIGRFAKMGMRTGLGASMKITTKELSYKDWVWFETNIKQQFGLDIPIRFKPNWCVEPKVTMSNEQPEEFNVSDSKSKVSVEAILVTPALAKKWLEGHKNVRPIRWNRVDAIANDIRDGNWKFTHQSICFDLEGNLLDGHHRLHAVLRSGKSIKMLVTRMDNLTIRDPIDQGSPRTIANITGLAPREVASLNALRQLELGHQVNVKMTLAEAQEMHEHHVDYILELHKVTNRHKLVGGIFAACVWAMPIDKIKVIDFATKVCTGEMISKGHPAYSMRVWKERHTRSSSWEVALAACNALRHYLTDTRLDKVYTGESGYRALTAKRRQLKVPYTPGTDVVVGVALTPQRGE